MGIDLHNGYRDLYEHIGHRIVVVPYYPAGQPDNDHDSEPHNIAIECETCSTVLLDFDAPATEPVMVFDDVGLGYTLGKVPMMLNVHHPQKKDGKLTYGAGVPFDPTPEMERNGPRAELFEKLLETER